MSIRLDNGGIGGGTSASVDTSNLVPYVGATSSLDLGTFNCSCNTLNYNSLNPPIAGASSGSLTEATSTILVITDGDNALLKNASIEVVKATAATSGYLDSTDFTTFNNKWAVQTTGAISGTAPVGVTAARQALGGALAISLTTGNLTSSSSDLVVAAAGSGSVLNAAVALSLTTGALTGTSPITVGACRVLGGASAISVTTANLVSTSSDLAVASSGGLFNTVNISLTTGAISGTAPISVTSGRRALGGALVVSIATGNTNLSKSFCITIPSGSATYNVWRTPYAITVINANCLVSGGTSLTGGLWEADANGINLAAITTAIAMTAGTNTGQTIGNASLDAGDYLTWVTTATAGTVEQLTTTVGYTVD